MSNEQNHRYDFILYFDVSNGNPNGDPDAGNLPRIDPETGHGLTTDVCLKRKVRNYVCMKHQLQAPFDIYVREKGVLTELQQKVYQELDLDDKDKKQKSNNVEKGREGMCKRFYDVRTFGAVMSLKEANCGQVRGPVQLTFGRSVDPVVPLEHTITRMAVATGKEAEDQGGDNRTMGRKYTVPYGLYCCHGFVSPQLAKQTGFSGEDLQLLWDALSNMFEFDRSATRGLMATQRLYIFKHESALGNAHAHRLFELVESKVRKQSDLSVVRSIADYYLPSAQDIEGSLPTGVSVQVLP